MSLSTIAYPHQLNRYADNLSVTRAVLLLAAGIFPREIVEEILLRMCSLQTLERVIMEIINDSDAHTRLSGRGSYSWTADNLGTYTVILSGLVGGEITRREQVCINQAILRKYTFSIFSMNPEMLRIGPDYNYYQECEAARTYMRLSKAKLC